MAATVFKPGSIGARLTNKAHTNSQAQVEQPYQQYLTAGKAALPSLYAPAYGDVSRQFAPQFSGARNYLAGNSAMANSGVGNKLNRLLMSGAYGALTNRMGESAAGVQQGGLDLLSQLLQRRVQARYDEQAKKKQGSGIGGLVGGIAGAFGGPLLSQAGQNLGSRIF